MRKVTSQAVRAFTQHRPFSSKNTKVVISSEGEARLILFGNLIARDGRDGFWISNQGYFTLTTKERLNGLLSTYGIAINQVRGDWFVNGHEWDGTWTQVCPRCRTLQKTLHALSRHGLGHICDDCGTREALQDYLALTSTN